MWFARRNLTPLQRAVAVPRLLLDELNRAAGALVRGRWADAGSVVRGIAAGLTRPWEGPVARWKLRELQRLYARDP